MHGVRPMNSIALNRLSPIGAIAESQYIRTPSSGDTGVGTVEIGLGKLAKVTVPPPSIPTSGFTKWAYATFADKILVSAAFGDANKTRLFPVV